jgi:hypothetical protein
MLEPAKTGSQRAKSIDIYKFKELLAPQELTNAKKNKNFK